MKELAELDVKKVIFALLRKLWLIVICAIVTGGMAYVYTDYFITPLYRASVTVYVNNYSGAEGGASSDYISSTNLSTSQRLVKTYVSIISSDTVLEKVVGQSNLNLSAAAVRGMMSASAVNNTEMFQVFISNADPEMAAQIANAIAEVAPAEIANILEGSSTKIIDYAKVPRSPYAPSIERNCVLGAAAGAALAAAFVIILTVFDQRIKNEEDLERIFDLPILGSIPEFGSEGKRSGYAYRYGYASKDQAQAVEGG